MALFQDRYSIIERYVRDRDVLDVGSLGQTHEYNLFAFLREHCGSLTGIDACGGDPKRNIVHASAEEYRSEERFDVIVMGDVIEHLGNPLRCLENMRDQLREDGRMIITTPNAKWPTVFLKPNPTHICWHDRHTLRCLLQLAGLEVERSWHYVGNQRAYPFFVLPLVLGQSLLFVARRSERAAAS